MLGVLSVFYTGLVRWKLRLRGARFWLAYGR
jgi:hypothetical protein